MNTTEDLIIDKIISETQELLKDNALWKPEFLARKFWDMGGCEQAEFFNTLANLIKNDFSQMQWRYMQSYLTKEGKNVIDDIKGHTDEEIL
jgi:folate-dependent tRNA-U54 methylase TrmFO/GidA